MFPDCIDRLGHHKKKQKNNNKQTSKSEGKNKQMNNGKNSSDHVWNPHTRSRLKTSFRNDQSCLP